MESDQELEAEAKVGNYFLFTFFSTDLSDQCG